MINPLLFAAARKLPIESLERIIKAIDDERLPSKDVRKVRTALHRVLLEKQCANRRKNK